MTDDDLLELTLLVTEHCDKERWHEAEQRLLASLELEDEESNVVFLKCLLSTVYLRSNELGIMEKFLDAVSREHPKFPVLRARYLCQVFDRTGVVPPETASFLDGLVEPLEMPGDQDYIDYLRKAYRKAVRKKV